MEQTQYRSLSEIGEEIDELEYDLAIMHETGEDLESPHIVNQIQNRINWLYDEMWRVYWEEP